LNKATFVFPACPSGFNRQSVGIMYEEQEGAPFESALTGKWHYGLKVVVDLPAVVKVISVYEDLELKKTNVTIIKRKQYLNQA